ncbi:DUF3224 domain-containing protein [Teredinibacter purpureus]|uniref:DUF3224 domain-containing protein n=1 Tax=Teredinibacter purpureus TaxID=2731756 RepID=UPI0005F83C4C|nr:DUF3224 domain-containing protein [Teredinibacter purpureus]
MEYKGEFQITGWDETALSDGENGCKLTQANVTQQYSGEAEGASTLTYLMQYQNEQYALFVGYETLEIHINGTAGSVVLQHDGEFKSGVAKSQFKIVAGSGKAACEGYTGHGYFTSTAGGKADYVIIMS